MKKYKPILDATLLLLLVILCLATIAPHTIVMPSQVQMVLLVVVLGLISAFLVLVWKEKPSDEREAENQHFASRMAYLAGCVVLIAVMLVQGVSHKLDAAIPITLLIMILTKLLAQQFKDKL
jgi:cobalamin synthase